jgi:membrane protein DedA with SNARE-associated domain
VNDALPITLPLGFENWQAAAQAITIGGLTFVQEDLPVISAALLAIGGKMPWSAAYLGSFFGIWVGDALLYLIARLLGRRVLEGPRVRRWIRPESVQKSEKWFAERGPWVLLLSRLVPGTRLPTYLAAGFLKAPLSKFLLLTGFAVAVWTTVIFLVARVAGPKAIQLTDNLGTGAWFLVLMTLAGMLLLRALVLVTAKVRALRHWEFWPAWLFYAPVVLNYIRLVIRYRGWTLPTAANPGIFSGGMVGESKFAILSDLMSSSGEFTARACLLAPGSTEMRFAMLESLRANLGIGFPCILKPDVGQRGVGVKVIRDAGQARDYLGSNTAPVILQEYIPGPYELGIFYYRFPDDVRGRIFAITEKIFPVITGDGVRTIEELILDDPRAARIAGTYLSRFAHRRHEILAPGELLKLVEAGNHAQGCIFRDGAHLWSSTLDERIDEISRKLDGFFVGRFDIRFESVEALQAGRDFKVIELNGAASEATNIYDARNSIWSAYRTLFQQWNMVFAIGAANRARGHMPTPAALLWRKWRQTIKLISTYPIAD